MTIVNARAGREREYPENNQLTNGTHSMRQS